MGSTDPLLEDPRAGLNATAGLAADFLAARRQARVSGCASDADLDARLDALDFSDARPLGTIAADMFDLLGTHAVRSDHPRYFGLFNPPALPAAIAGDLIAATVNPQLAVRSHAPAAVAIERKLLRVFGARIGWAVEDVSGTFTGGGSEANHTALLAALARRYPEWPEHGLRNATARPAIYVSAQAHLAWIKIARSAGLGGDAVRLVPTRDGLRLDAGTLAGFIAEDKGRDPVLVVATAGTTAHGAIDDLPGIAAVARDRGAHFHVDAAWAGGALLSDEGKDLLRGIDAADSVTIDPHKWLCVPMGAGMFLSRDWAPLETAFAVSTGYMPSASREQRDPYLHSLQWSRRFIGIKLFMALANLGMDGYARMIRRQFELGQYLRTALMACGWQVLNDSALPLACFAPGVAADRQDAVVRRIVDRVVASGEAWLSTVDLRGRLVIRACITSHETTQEDVDALLGLLAEARSRALNPAAGGTP
jgi:glutamate/tyrosine decarboxylase-like PLP-dependent enzyme